MQTITEKDCNGTEYTICVQSHEEFLEEHANSDPGLDMMSYALCVAANPDFAKEDPISPEKFARWEAHFKATFPPGPPPPPYEPAVGHVVMYRTANIDQSVRIDRINDDGTINVIAVYIGERNGPPTKWVAKRDEIIEIQ